MLNVPRTHRKSITRRAIEVKGRVGVGDVELIENE